MKIKGFSIFVFAFIIGSLALSCKKGPGDGGRASITGTVFATNYSNAFQPIDSGLIGGQKVYIQYGDEVGASDNVDTDYKGRYTFPYLRKGRYTVFVYSKKLQNNTIDTPIVRMVNITGRTEDLNLPRIDIKTLKN
jgi:hypothetical protein